MPEQLNIKFGDQGEPRDIPNNGALHEHERETSRRPITDLSAAAEVLNHRYRDKNKAFISIDPEVIRGELCYRFREAAPEIDSFHPPLEYVVWPNGTVLERRYVPDEVRRQRH